MTTDSPDADKASDLRKTAEKIVERTCQPHLEMVQTKYVSEKPLKRFIPIRANAHIYLDGAIQLIVLRFLMTQLTHPS